MACGIGYVPSILFGRNLPRIESRRKSSRYFTFRLSRENVFCQVLSFWTWLRAYNKQVPTQPVEFSRASRTFQDRKTREFPQRNHGNCNLKPQESRRALFWGFQVFWHPSKTGKANNLTENNWSLK